MGEKIPLLDANVLLGRHPRTSAGAATAAELMRWMDRVGIDEALVGHTASWLHEPATGNQQVVDLLAGGSDRLRPCWVVLPTGCGEQPEPADLVAKALACDVAAARAYPADHGWSLTGRDGAPVLRALAAARLPLLIDADQSSWSEIEECGTAHPDLPLVICQTGYRSLRRIAGVLSRTDNVVVDVSNLSTHQGLEWLVGRFGKERLVFGTGLPWRDPAEAVTRLLWSELDDDAVRAIGAGNLRALLRPRKVRAA